MTAAATIAALIATYGGVRADFDEETSCYIVPAPGGVSFMVRDDDSGQTVGVIRYPTLAQLLATQPAPAGEWTPYTYAAR